MGRLCKIKHNNERLINILLSYIAVGTYINIANKFTN